MTPASPQHEKQTSLPEIGFIRLKQIIGPGNPIPVSKSTWWAGVKTGRFPKSIKLGPGITVWRVEVIRDLIARLAGTALSLLAVLAISAFLITLDGKAAAVVGCSGLNFVSTTMISTTPPPPWKDDDNVDIRFPPH